MEEFLQVKLFCNPRICFFHKANVLLCLAGSTAAVKFRSAITQLRYPFNKCEGLTDLVLQALVLFRLVMLGSGFLLGRTFTKSEEGRHEILLKLEASERRNKAESNVKQHVNQTSKVTKPVENAVCLPI